MTRRPRTNHKLPQRILKIGGISALVVCLFLSAVWANLAIAYQLSATRGVWIVACLVLSMIALVALVAVVRHWRRRWRVLLIYAVAYAIFLGWSSSISATNDKNWSTDVAHGVTGTIDGDRLSVCNLRDFTWRTETDFTERWEERTYDLSKVRSLDFVPGLLDGTVDRPTLS